MERRIRDLPAKCRRCGCTTGVISKYKLLYCRHCFREVARRIGFKKYS